MAQEYERIIDLLQDMQKTNNANADSLDRLLYELSVKIDGKQSVSSDLIGAYINEITRSLEDKYNVTLNKFQDIEQALRAVYSIQSDAVTGSDLRSLFDMVSKSINNFYTEARQEKAILAGIESKISDIMNNKSDKEDILRTISLLRNDFENINHVYKNTIENVNTNLKTIISNLIRLDPLKLGDTTKQQVEIMFNSVQEIMNKLQEFDEKSIKLERILNNVATNEDLKIAKSITEAILSKTEKIESIVINSADKNNVEDIKHTVEEINNRSKDNGFDLLSRTEDIINNTNEVKQILGNIAKDIDNIQNSTELDDSIKNLHTKIEDLSKEIETANINFEMNNVSEKLTNIKDEFEMIKSIINDLNESLSSNIISAIDNMSIKSGNEDLKNYITEILNEVPKKEDIDKLLEKNSYIFQSLIEKTDKFTDKLDNFTKLEEEFFDEISDKVDLIPEYRRNFEEISKEQQITGDKLDDIVISQESISEKQKNLYEKIANVDFDKEFSSIYGKTTSIESWLIESNIKENSEKIASQIQNTTTLADLEEVNKRTNQIVEFLQTLSKSEDIESISNNILKINDGLNNVITLLNNSSLNEQNLEITDKLTDLERSISQIVSRNEFNDFIEDLKYCITKLSTSTGSCSDNLEQMLQLRKDLEDKLNSFDFSQVIRILNGKFDKLQEYLTEKISSEIKNNIYNEINKNLKENSTLEDIKNSVEIVVDLNEKIDATNNNLASIDEFIRNNLPIDSEYIKNEINDIKNILLNDIDKQQISDGIIENDFDLDEVKEYLENIKVLISENSNNDLIYRISTIEDMINTNHTFDESVINKILENVNQLGESLDYLTEEKTQIKQAFEELNNISSRISEISDMFNNNSEKIPDIEQPYALKLEKMEEFLTKKLDNLKNSLDNMSLSNSSQANSDFTYLESITENKLDLLIDLINNLKENNTNDNSQYLNKKFDYVNSELANLKEELNLVSTDITESLNSEIDKFSQELTATKQLILQFRKADNKNEIKQEIEALHKNLVTDEISPQNTLLLENLHEKFDEQLLITEENIKDLVLSDTDAIISKIESIKDYIDKSSQQQTPPDVYDNQELKDFKNEITQFKSDFEQTVKNATDSIISHITHQNEEIKSLITIANNHDEILTEIANLKSFFKSITPTEDFEITDNVEEFTDLENTNVNDFINQYGKDIENSDFIEDTEQSEKINEINSNYDDICRYFETFTKKIEELSDKNTSISEILTSISKKIEETYAPRVISNQPKIDATDDEVLTEEKQTFDFVHAFELMQNDITELKNTIAGINSLDQINKNVKETASKNDIEDELYVEPDEIDAIDNIDRLDNESIENNNENNEKNVNTDNLTAILSKKIDKVLNKLNNNWLDNVKNYIALRNDDITSRLDSISSKLDIMVADTTSSDLLESMSDTVYGIDEKLSDLDESDRQLTAMLEELSQKISEISLISDNSEDINDIKNLIAEQKTIIETLEPSEKLDTFKQCLEELTTEVSNLATDTGIGNKNLQQSVCDMKESLMAAVINIFGQVSFVEESEDIKDFVEERTDEINKNIELITKQIQQISSGVPSEYHYSLQDVETDLAKLRLALNELKVGNDSKIEPDEMAIINEKLHSITSLVDTLTQGEMQELKSEITTLKEQTQFLIATSDKSYNALNSGIVGFEEIINDSLTGKVDQVTKMLEKSADSDNVIKQALIYMGEWIDSASEKINTISSNSEAINQNLNTLKTAINTDVTKSLENKFDMWNANLQKLERKFANIENLEEQISRQQDRIDRLEINIDKLLSIVENMDDTTSARKIDKIEKQLSKLSSSIEKLTSYVE